MNKVFLSYSSKDSSFVNRLAVDLQARGFDVWLDQWELSVGDSLMDEIQKGIKQSSWLLIILSPHAVESKWVKEELNSGLARQLAEDEVYVLPILYTDCEIPAFLQDKVYADFRQDYYDGFQCLISALERRYLEKFRKDLSQRLSDRAQRVLDDHLHSYGASFGDSYLHGPYGNGYRVLNLDRTRERSLDLLLGLWHGPTGRVHFSMDEKQLKGRYDWQGIEFSGQITGTLKLDAVIAAVIFNWTWDVSGENGGGIFYWPISNFLIGGWWMKYDYINPQELLKTYKMPPNHWMFSRFEHDW